LSAFLSSLCGEVLVKSLFLHLTWEWIYLHCRCLIV
jgi:hypothetical protein